MVIGGQDQVDKIGEVELVSLDPASNPVPECLNNLASLPYAVAGLSAGMTSGKEIWEFVAKKVCAIDIFQMVFHLYVGVLLRWEIRLLIFGVYRTNGLPVNLPVNIFLPEQTGKKDLESKESLGYWERLKPGC